MFYTCGQLGPVKMAAVQRALRWASGFLPSRLVHVYHFRSCMQPEAEPIIQLVTLDTQVDLQPHFPNETQRHVNGRPFLF